jgi:hypothetical protein
VFGRLFSQSGTPGNVGSRLVERVFLLPRQNHCDPGLPLRPWGTQWLANQHPVFFLQIPQSSNQAALSSISLRRLRLKQTVCGTADAGNCGWEDLRLQGIAIVKCDGFCVAGSFVPMLCIAVVMNF